MNLARCGFEDLQELCFPVFLLELPKAPVGVVGVLGMDFIPYDVAEELLRGFTRLG